MCILISVMLRGISKACAPSTGTAAAPPAGASVDLTVSPATPALRKSRRRGAIRSSMCGNYQIDDDRVKDGVQVTRLCGELSEIAHWPWAQMGLRTKGACAAIM